MPKSPAHTHRVRSRGRAADRVLPWKQTCCWPWSGPHERATKENQTPTRRQAAGTEQEANKVK